MTWAIKNSPRAQYRHICVNKLKNIDIKKRNV